VNFLPKAELSGADMKCDPDESSSISILPSVGIGA
jgi:hypothetical protein